MPFWSQEQDGQPVESYIRLASPNERRCIAREDLGFYRALVVGGVYNFYNLEVDWPPREIFAKALQDCIKRHPPLSVVVQRQDTESPVYVACAIEHPEDHVRVLPPVHTHDEQQVEDQMIEKRLPSILDESWPKGSPPWRLVVLPFSDGDEENKPQKCFIAFSFSHALGDGISGLAFHRTLLTGLQHALTGQGDASRDQKGASTHILAPPFDTPGTLPISWSYLFSPLLAVYLPKFIAFAFGFRAAFVTTSKGTWTAAPSTYEAEKHTTGVKLCIVEELTLKKALRICRQRKTRITGLLSQVIVHALGESLPESANATEFVSQVAVNMRRPVGISNDEMGLYVSGYYEMYPTIKNKTTDMQNTDLGFMTEERWQAARTTTEALAKVAATLQDQPIGLLRYLPSIRSWTLGKMGQARDCSYELSNLGSFDPESDNLRIQAQQSGQKSRGGRKASVDIDRMIFSQPANATSAPLTFNAISIKNGDLVIAITWQVGVLGLGRPAAEIEEAFVTKISEIIHEDFERLD